MSSHRQGVRVLEVVSGEDVDGLILPPLALVDATKGRGQRLNLGLGFLNGDPVSVVNGHREEAAVPVGPAVVDVPWPGGGGGGGSV